MRLPKPRSLVLGTLIATLSLPSAISATPAGPLHPGCWVVVDPKDKADLNNAEEVLCIDRAGHGSIRESAMYGEGVKGCNVVTISPKDGKFVVGVDYSHCTNDSPSHRLTCDAAATSGAFSCAELMASEKGGEGTAVKLAPLPDGM